MHSIEGLERGIEHAKKNIKTFEDAIKKERETIDEYHKMIDTLKQKQRDEEHKKQLQESVNANPSGLLH